MPSFRLLHSRLSSPTTRQHFWTPVVLLIMSPRPLKTCLTLGAAPDGHSSCSRLVKSRYYYAANRGVPFPEYFQIYSLPDLKLIFSSPILASLPMILTHQATLSEQYEEPLETSFVQSICIAPVGEGPRRTLHLAVCGLTRKLPVFDSVAFRLSRWTASL